MAQTQKTIRFNKESEQLVRQICPTGEENYNFAVNQVFQRYSVLTQYLMPEFKKNEWQAICQAFNGRLFNADIELEAKAFSFGVRQAIQYDENVRVLLCDDPLKTDFPEFLAKIDTLSIPQIIAVFQKVHDFWTPKNGQE